MKAIQGRCILIGPSLDSGLLCGSWGSDRGSVNPAAPNATWTFIRAVTSKNGFFGATLGWLSLHHAFSQTSRCQQQRSYNNSQMRKSAQWSNYPGCRLTTQFLDKFCARWRAFHKTLPNWGHCRAGQSASPKNRIVSQINLRNKTIVVPKNHII